jgi:hypothetical protein
VAEAVEFTREQTVDPPICLSNISNDPFQNLYLPQRSGNLISAKTSTG